MHRDVGFQYHETASPPNYWFDTHHLVLATLSVNSSGLSSLRGSNHIKLTGGIKFGDLVLSIVERYLIQCPYIGGSSMRGSTVVTGYEFMVK